ncbi:hypothetical protein ACP70R_033335 [Stipagrostis hirtigluma subsp. patula]
MEGKSVGGGPKDISCHSRSPITCLAYPFLTRWPPAELVVTGNGRNNIVDATVQAPSKLGLTKEQISKESSVPAKRSSTEKQTSRSFNKPKRPRVGSIYNCPSGGHAAAASKQVVAEEAQYLETIEQTMIYASTSDAASLPCAIEASGMQDMKMADTEEELAQHPSSCPDPSQLKNQLQHAALISEVEENSLLKFHPCRRDCCTCNDISKRYAAASVLELDDLDALPDYVLIGTCHLLEEEKGEIDALVQKLKSELPLVVARMTKANMTQQYNTLVSYVRLFA